jgi:hypothetical protein
VRRLPNFFKQLECSSAEHPLCSLFVLICCFADWSVLTTHGTRIVARFGHAIFFAQHSEPNRQRIQKGRTHRLGLPVARYFGQQKSVVARGRDSGDGTYESQMIGLWAMPELRLPRSALLRKDKAPNVSGVSQHPSPSQGLGLFRTWWHSSSFVQGNLGLGVEVNNLAYQFPHGKNPSSTWACRLSDRRHWNVQARERFIGRSFGPPRSS